MDFPLPFPGFPIVFLGLKQQTLVPFLNWRDPLEKEEATHSSILGLLWRLCKESVKNPPAMWETWVQSLGWEDPLEEGMATHTPVFLPGEAPRTEEPGRLQSTGSQRVGHD